MRLTIVLCLFAAAALLAACGGSSSTKTPTPQPTLAGSSPTVPGVTPISTPARTPTPAPATTPVAASTPNAAGSLEVTGIVGTVSVASQKIEIKRTQGANITQLELGPRTVIRKAAGGTTQLRDIKPSDRIIARGTLNDRRDTLLVTEITVQDILPGAQPGG